MSEYFRSTIKKEHWPVHPYRYFLIEDRLLNSGLGLETLFTKHLKKEHLKKLIG